MTKRRTWLIAYDICDHRRLARVQRFLSKEAIAVQYSVFVTELTDRHVDRLQRRLMVLIDARADDVRFYVLTDVTAVDAIGASRRPEGIWMFGPALAGLGH